MSAAASGKKASLEEMLEEFLNPRPRSIEAAEDVISGGATVMPFHEEFQAESASRGKLVKKNVKEALPMRAADLSMGTRYQGNKVSRKDLEEEGWEIEESDEDDDEEEDQGDAVPKEKVGARKLLDVVDNGDEEQESEGEAMHEEDDDDEAEENGFDEEDDDDEDDDDVSDEEIEIGEGAEIVIKPKAQASPNKRKREAEEDMDDESEEDIDSESEAQQGQDEDDEEGMESTELLGDVEQEDQEKLEKELRKLREEEKAAVTSIKSDNQKELEKAVHAKNQKLLWNSFMELRISLQQMLNLANRFPHPEAHALFTTPLTDLGEKSGQRKTKRQKTEEQDEQDEEDDHPENDDNLKLKTVFEEASSSLGTLFDDLFSAKKALIASNDSFAPVLKVAARKVKDSEGDEEGITTSTQAPSWEEFKSVEDEMWKKTDEVIDRWNRKTMLSQGIMQKELKAINRTVLNQITQLLSDRERMVKRTQLKRSSAKTFGAALYDNKMKNDEQQQNDGLEQKRHTKKEEYDEEIFDDSDFYHQLLREVVESGTSNVTDPIALGRSFAQLRQMLRKNKKKDVDQKASKGRKLRYEVMESLVNYMPPITTKQQVSPMAAELFSHLFSS